MTAHCGQVFAGTPGTGPVTSPRLASAPGGSKSRRCADALLALDDDRVAVGVPADLLSEFDVDGRRGEPAVHLEPVELACEAFAKTGVLGVYELASLSHVAAVDDRAEEFVVEVDVRREGDPLVRLAAHQVRELHVERDGDDDDLPEGERPLAALSLRELVLRFQSRPR